VSWWVRNSIVYFDRTERGSDRSCLVIIFEASNYHCKALRSKSRAAIPLSKALGNITKDIGCGTKISCPFAPSREAYATKRQMNQKASEDAPLEYLSTNTAWSQIMLLAHRPNTNATNTVQNDRPKRYTQVTTAQSGLELRYPLPTNRTFYLPLEVVKILGTIDRNLKGGTILEWIKKKLVPVTKSAV
jgi:hypothetical protein